MTLQSQWDNNFQRDQQPHKRHLRYMLALVREQVKERYHRNSLKLFRRLSGNSCLQVLALHTPSSLNTPVQEWLHCNSPIDMRKMVREVDN